ncbi:MAG: TVP38/TMEM64 family protein [Ruminococcaceae bacterium]|nr:TVP38/TMEM64 family protein [Oscillospiraceae bacterium]
MNNNFDKSIRKRKIFSVISIIVLLAVTGWLTIFVWKWLSEFSQEGFRDYINSFGVWGWLVLLGLQILQVFVALIPGELLESAAGFAFGPFLGTVICYVGVAIGSAIIFFLTRRFGIKLVEIFVAREKINELRFLKTPQRRNLFIFLVFFIPGTPKDLLTYFVGLTDIKFISFLSISLFARIPSVLSSTFGGHLIGEEKYIGAIALYTITGIISLAGLMIYNKTLKKKNLADSKDSELS